jgi:hypothetical protein
VCRGFVAGALGTAAMTVSSTLEMRLRGREPSTVPARAAAKVLGVEPAGDVGAHRFATIVHWAYGSGWGAARGAIGALGLRGASATVAFFVVVWGFELALLPRLDVGVPPVSEWQPPEIAVDALHHAVYATATGAVYERLTDA